MCVNKHTFLFSSVKICKYRKAKKRIHKHTRCRRFNIVRISSLYQEYYNFVDNAWSDFSLYFLKILRQYCVNIALRGVAPCVLIVRTAPAGPRSGRKYYARPAPDPEPALVPAVAGFFVGTAPVVLV